MNTAALLPRLKADLHISTTAIDNYLTDLLLEAETYIATEGATLDAASPGDAGLVVRYAAFLHRARNGAETEMPRYLRWELNNRILGEKAAVADD